MDTVKGRLERLESICGVFDPSKYQSYVALMRSFIAKARRAQRGRSDVHSMGTPFFDITSGSGTELSADVKSRLEAIIEHNRSFTTPWMDDVCRWYINEIATANATGSVGRDESHYEELIRLMESGGDFYCEAGFVFVGHCGIPLDKS